MRVGLFIDTGNLYHAVKTTYDSKIDYRAVLAYVRDLGTVEVANAYGLEMGKGSMNFKTKLQEIGYCVKLKAGATSGTGRNLNVEIALDVAALIHDLDLIVLCSSDGQLAPVLDLCKRYGKDSMVIGSAISAALEPDVKVEIPSSFIMRSDHELG